MDSSSCCIDSSSSSSSSYTAAAAVVTSDEGVTVSPQPQRMGSGASTLTVSDAAGGADAESRKLPSSKYKGVVPQPNGRWGAQIYEKHQRVWLGTFNLEREAARAYDVAAQRFRGRDAAANFPQLSADAAGGAHGAEHELAFLLSRSKAEVVDMLRKHTYADELRHSLRRSPPPLSATSLPTTTKPPAREHLFDKAVTPSDVGKLNRLVIPKQHAEKHFPLPTGDGEGAKGLLLAFEDGGGKVWRFRYSYWNSSQSYVLTKGWSRFVKEKGLKAGDIVGFYCSKAGERQLYIECRLRCAAGGNHGVLPLQRVVRLFGVDIGKVAAAAAAAAAVNENGKRNLETVEVSAAGCVWLKKQCAVGL